MLFTKIFVCCTLLVNALYLYFSTSMANPSLEVLLCPFPPSPPLSPLIFPQNGRLIFLVFVSSPPVDRWIDHVTWSSSPPTGQGGESFVATFVVDLLLQDGGGCKRRRRGRGARALVIIMNFFQRDRWVFYLGFPATRN